MSIKAGMRPRGMAAVPGGRFLMGSDDFYPEERPTRPAMVTPLYVDIFPVTNSDFVRFVEATGYQTDAEKVEASWVFAPASGPVDLRGQPVWWEICHGASWRLPEGLGSSISGREDHPVVHVSKLDAEAYAMYDGRRLPDEAEWEFAARGGLEGARFAWGETLLDEGRYMANTWQGVFPHHDTAEDGFAGTSPVGSYPPGGYGTYDMIGNVWEWTASAAAGNEGKGACCAGAKGEAGFVLKGGSFLCAPEYCRRYRPAARMIQHAQFSSSHVGFRCAASFEAEH